MNWTRHLPRLRKAGYIFLGILTLVVLGLSIMEVWVIYSVDDFTAYGSAPAESNGFPQADQRGAFLILNEPHDPKFVGNLVTLLATTEPGVIEDSESAHLRAGELNAVLVQSAVVSSDVSDYRVYRLNDPSPEPMTYERQPGGKDLLVKPKDGTWGPGPYLIDIPAEGMFGGRTYFQFTIDPEK
jgi:hypothetical protein